MDFYAAVAVCHINWSVRFALYKMCKYLIKRTFVIMYEFANNQRLLLCVFYCRDKCVFCSYRVFRLYFWLYAVFALYTELMTPATVIINLSINGQTLFYKIQISEMQKSSEKSSDLNSSCAQLKHFYPFPRTRHIRLNFNYRYLLSYNIKSFVLYCIPSYDTRNRPVTSSRWWIFVFLLFLLFLKTHWCK